MKDLFKTKPLSKLFAEVENNEGGLHRHLTRMNLIFIGVGAVIGAGIFVITGTAAALHAGPALVISFVISAIGCALAGLCYAEFASMIPIAGSAYTYSYTTMGELVAWIIGWDLILEYLFGAATVAVGWSGYVNSFLEAYHIHIPAQLSQSPFIYDATGWHTSGAIINFPAVFIIFILSSLLVIGIKESAKLNNIVVLIKVAVILLFIGFGIAYINTDNWVPFIPKNTGDYGHFGWSGIFAGAGVIFFAYIGFDAISTTSQEAINPKKDMPVGILVSLLVCTILYISVCLILTGIVPYQELNVSAPIALAIDKAGMGLFWLNPLIKIGAIAGLSSVVLVLLMGQSRIFFSMSRDGLLSPIFSKVHSKYKTPYLTTIITGIVAAFFAGIFPIGLLGELVSIGTLLAFTIVCVGVWVLRVKNPDAPRAFKTPLVPFVPIAGIIVCLIQMASLPRDTWIRLFAWMAIGFVIYFTYSIKHSKVRNDKK